MRILIDAISDNDFVRGPDRYVLGLLEGLAALGADDHYVVAHAPWQPYFPEATLPGNFERLCLTPPRDRILRLAWHATMFPRVANRLAPDVVHLTNIIYAPGLAAPTVMTVHDLAHFRFPEKFGFLRGRLQRRLLRAAIDLADRVVAVSRFTAGDIAEFTAYPATRVRIVLEGAPSVRPGTARSGGRPYFLYVGQLERSKNVEALIAEFLASEALADCDLLVAGKPGNATQLIEAQAARSPDRVRLLGYVDEDELAALYRGCLAFVFPSLVEGFGLVLAEAMAYGAPVVAMATSAIPEVVGDAGILVDPAQGGGLRRAMETLRADEALRRRLAASSIARAAGFSWRTAAEQTRAVFLEAKG